MKGFLRKRGGRVPELKAIARSLDHLRDRFRRGELAWEEYILHGTQPHSLSNVDERRFQNLEGESSS